MEPGFWFLWPSYKIDKPIDVLLVGKLRHVIEEDLEEEFGDIGAFMFLPVDRFGNKLRNKVGVFFEKFCGVV